MFSATRHLIAAMALGACFILPAQATSSKPGDIANTRLDISQRFSRAA
jgi:alkaline phosphatase isozyme conversion protein